MSWRDSERKAQEMSLLKEIRIGLVSCLQKVEVVNEAMDKVASPIIGIPASWLCNSWKPRLHCLGPRLVARVSVQIHAMLAIIHALSRRSSDSESRTIGSFLFLCDYGQGSRELVEAFADQLSDRKDLVMRFNISDFKDLRPTRCPRDYKDEDQGARGKLMEAVKKTPFCVLLLLNVDMDNDYAVEVLLDIMEHGRLIDSLVNAVDFSKTLVIITSDIGKNVILPFRCNCLVKDWDHPIKQETFHPLKERPKHGCTFYPVLIEVGAGGGGQYLQTTQALFIPIGS